MGNCCVKRKKTMDNGYFVNEIIRKTKLVNMNFETAYFSLTGEELGIKIDNMRLLNFTEFEKISKSKFFEEDITKNDFANIHNCIFTKLMSRCESPKYPKKINLWKILLFILPFLNNSNCEKLTYFFQITQFLLVAENNLALVLNLRYCFRLYLENNLIFVSSSILEYIKDNNDNYTVHPQFKQEIIVFLGKCVKFNMRKFMIEKISGAFDLGEDELVKMIDIDQFKYKLEDKKFLFDFFELREYYGQLYYNLGDIRVTFNNIDYTLLNDEDYLKYEE